MEFCVGCLDISTCDLICTLCKKLQIFTVMVISLYFLCFSYFIMSLIFSWYTMIFGIISSLGQFHILTSLFLHLHFFPSGELRCPRMLGQKTIDDIFVRTYGWSGEAEWTDVKDWWWLPVRWKARWGWTQHKEERCQLSSLLCPLSSILWHPQC